MTGGWAATNMLRQVWNDLIQRVEAAEAKNAKLSALIVEQEAEYRKEKRAAEARCARLQQALEHISETANWYARNNARLQHEVDHCLCVEIPSIADEALAGLDTPADTGEAR